MQNVDSDQLAARHCTAAEILKHKAALRLADLSSRYPLGCCGSSMR